MTEKELAEIQARVSRMEGCSFSDSRSEALYYAVRGDARRLLDDIEDLRCAVGVLVKLAISLAEE